MYEAQINQHDPIPVELQDRIPHLNGQPFQGEIIRVDDRTFRILQQGQAHTVHLVSVQADQKAVLLKVNGKRAEVALTTEMDRLLKRLGLENVGAAAVSDIKAPMPGLIHDILVGPGDVVAKGEPVLILEAMKMENVIKAPADVTIAEIHAEKGASVEKGALLVSFQ